MKKDEIEIGRRYFLKHAGRVWIGRVIGPGALDSNRYSVRIENGESYYDALIHPRSFRCTAPRKDEPQPAEKQTTPAAESPNGYNAMMARKEEIEKLGFTCAECGAKLRLDYRPGSIGLTVEKCDCGQTYDAGFEEGIEEAEAEAARVWREVKRGLATIARNIEAGIQKDVHLTAGETLEALMTVLCGADEIFKEASALKEVIQEAGLFKG